MTADAIVAFVLTVSLLCIFYGPWQEVCTDIARQYIFEKRDRLFDIAADGRLDFASSEYRDVRRGLESMIRFAHELTWPQLMIFGVQYARHKNSFPKPAADSAVSRIADAALRAEVGALLKDATGMMMAMVLSKSILVAPLLFIVVIVALCTKTANSALGLLRDGNHVVRDLGSAIRDTAERAHAL
jgi:hypothetical protein